MFVSIVAGCARELPHPTLPAPDWERPAGEVRSEDADAGQVSFAAQELSPRISEPLGASADDTGSEPSELPIASATVPHRRAP